jgi:Uma2 family endonuclease
VHMPKIDRRWTTDDLRELPDDGRRYEVIDGQLFVTPAPSWTHQAAVLLLSRILDDYLRDNSVGHVIIAPADVSFSRSRSVQPDLFVVPSVDGRRPRRFDEVRRLLLAVEVLSPNSARADRVAKRVLFREEGVAEYWVVDLDSRMIERSTPADPRVEILIERIDWRPDGAGAALSIDLPEYFSCVLNG